MALVAAEPSGALVELEFGDSLGSLVRLLESQRELFHGQIDQLQNLVVAQCKLTGVNPLAQEMAAGALSIRIGKRPRDLLNPKAVKYLQSVFSIKDTIGKKETREISALCGVTLSQVREFFAGQRSKVRKLVRVACEKSTKAAASNTSQEECSYNLDHSLPISIIKPPSGNAADVSVVGELKPVSGSTGILGIVNAGQLVTLNSVEPVKVEEGHPKLLQEETVPGVDSDDKEFLDKIFNMMRKEHTFSGQVKLMEWVLRIQNSAVLNWFSNNGGASILATWLNEAAVEEQTTVLLVILKVLYHLPLHKALPLHLSAIVPAVNRLRFYRTSGISNRARILLSRWSKVLKSQSLKRPLASSSKATLKEMSHKQSMSRFLEGELFQSKLDVPEEFLALTGSTEITRATESKQTLKLLPAPSADSNRKHDRSIASTKSKARRKVLLVEHPDHKASGRSAQVVRTIPSNHSRPMSADDIQKAKMRAMFMQHKYGKTEPSSSGSKSLKIEDQQAPCTQPVGTSSECIPPEDPVNMKEENSTPTVPTEENIANEPVTSNPDPNSTSEHGLGILSCKPIHWKIPQGVQISSSWSVGAGENSKEFDVQTQRNRREKEAVYSSLEDIPPNPKDPWDLEMDFDDSLTPEIPTEQPPEADADEVPPFPPNQPAEAAPAAVAVPLPDVATSSGTAPSTSGAAGPQAPAPAPEPDLELLAVLLKNPDLVFALTSSQGKNMSSEEMVSLLDMLKRNGVGLSGMLNALAHQKENAHQTNPPREQDPPLTSLPSPTPPSEAERSAWRSDFPTLSRTTFLQPHPFGNRSSAAAPQTAAALQHHAPQAPSVSVRAQASSAQPQPASIFSVPQVMVGNNSATQNLPPASFLPSRAMATSQQTGAFDNQYPVTNTAFISSAPRQESYVVHSTPAIPALSHNLQRSQPLQKAEAPPTFSHTAPAWPATAARRDPTPDRILGQANGALEAPTVSQHYYPSQNYGALYPSGLVSQAQGLSGRRGDRNGFLDGEGETWRSDGSPVRSPEFNTGWGYNDDSRRDNNGRPHRRNEWSSTSGRQWSSASRDRDGSGGGAGGKRWRDYNHGRRR